MREYDILFLISNILVGLELEFYIEQKDYLPFDTTMAAGIRLLVHNQTYMPMLDDTGITLAPGFESNIGITRVSLSFWKYVRCPSSMIKKWHSHNFLIFSQPTISFLVWHVPMACFSSGHHSVIGCDLIYWNPNAACQHWIRTDGKAWVQY